MQLPARDKSFQPDSPKEGSLCTCSREANLWENGEKSRLEMSGKRRQPHAWPVGGARPRADPPRSAHAWHRTPAWARPGPARELRDGDVSQGPTGTAQEGPGLAPLPQPESPRPAETREAQRWVVAATLSFGRLRADRGPRRRASRQPSLQGAGQASFANTFRTQDSATPLALGRGSPVRCQRGAETSPRGRLAGGPGRSAAGPGREPAQGG